jgi:hypothetical protein
MEMSKAERRARFALRFMGQPYWVCAIAAWLALVGLTVEERRSAMFHAVAIADARRHPRRKEAEA